MTTVDMAGNDAAAAASKRPTRDERRSPDRTVNKGSDDERGRGLEMKLDGNEDRMPLKAPDQRRRRNLSPSFRILPAGGRKGRAPGWPLPSEPTEYQARRWRELWHTPQACAWEDSGDVRPYVAQFVVLESWTLRRDCTPAERTECRHMSDRLGLTPKALKLLGWQVEDGDPADSSGTGAGVKVAKIIDYRGRMSS